MKNKLQTRTLVTLMSAFSFVLLTNPLNVFATTYTDGTYTGTLVDATYGNVQVQAVISGGKLTNVIWLSHPDAQANSVRINNAAMPILTQEAIAAQSANVAAASGASFTSPAFVQSLSAALALATVTTPTPAPTPVPTPTPTPTPTPAPTPVPIPVPHYNFTANTPNLNVSSTVGGQSIGQVTQGMQGTINSSQAWYNVTFSNGLTGWIQGANMPTAKTNNDDNEKSESHTTADSINEDVFVAAPGVNVRSAAGVGGSVVGIVLHGETGTVIDTKNIKNVAWNKISFNKGKTGWVRAKYIKPTSAKSAND